MISDIAGESGETAVAVGEPYYARQLRRQDPAMCLLNADNYVWFALESWWTRACYDELKEQGHRFDEPVDPNDDDTDD